MGRVLLPRNQHDYSTSCCRIFIVTGKRFMIILKVPMVTTKDELRFDLRHHFCVQFESG